MTRGFGIVIAACQSIDLLATGEAVETAVRAQKNPQTPEETASHQAYKDIMVHLGNIQARMKKLGEEVKKIREQEAKSETIIIN